MTYQPDDRDRVRATLEPGEYIVSRPATEAAAAMSWTPMDDPRIVELRLILWRALRNAGVRLDDRQAEIGAVAVLAEWSEWTDPAT